MGTRKFEFVAKINFFLIDFSFFNLRCGYTVCNGHAVCSEHIAHALHNWYQTAQLVSNCTTGIKLHATGIKLHNWYQTAELVSNCFDSI